MPNHRGGTDEIFDVLSNRHRRRLLVTLWERVRNEATNDFIGLGDVATADGDKKRVRIEMVHYHLPKLEALGYIEWDRDAGRIARGPEWTGLAAVLCALSESPPD